MKLFGYSALIALCAGISSCGSNKEEAMLTKSGLDPQNFETVVNGDSTRLVTLRNAAGMEVCITNYGGRIVSLMVPDKEGTMQDVVLGFDSIGAYLPDINKSDFGAAIGRYANRINQGRFVLDGDTIQLPQNNFGHCLHGGTDMGTLGWQYRVYKVENATDSTFTISIDSPDGDNQFPGNVKATVTYTLQADNALRIDYEATTDKATIINLTNHSYFNLSGDPELSVLDETIWINADNFTPVDSTFMTTGEIIPVKDTPMDFTEEKLLGKDIESEYIQVKYGNGFDHNFVLNTKGNLDECAARVTDPRSGIVLEVFTNEPGIQFYTGNFLDGTVTGKKAKVYNQRHALCLETQKYPDTPNKPNWPSATLRPGETYKSTCIYKFSTKK
ncbi:MAG: galactose mutarotase [Muribaculaceae bacterium]|nr:galactose mutarotase [Muribaculaceae bacterium]